MLETHQAICIEVQEKQLHFIGTIFKTRITHVTTTDDEGYDWFDYGCKNLAVKG